MTKKQNRFTQEREWLVQRLHEQGGDEEVIDVYIEKDLRSPDSDASKRRIPYGAGNAKRAKQWHKAAI